MYQHLPPKTFILRYWKSRLPGLIILPLMVVWITGAMDLGVWPVVLIISGIALTLILFMGFESLLVGIRHEKDHFLISGYTLFKGVYLIHFERSQLVDISYYSRGKLRLEYKVTGQGTQVQKFQVNAKLNEGIDEMLFMMEKLLDMNAVADDDPVITKSLKRRHRMRFLKSLGVLSLLLLLLYLSPNELEPTDLICYYLIIILTPLVTTFQEVIVGIKLKEDVYTIETYSLIMGTDTLVFERSDLINITFKGRSTVKLEWREKAGDLKRNYQINALPGEGIDEKLLEMGDEASRAPTDANGRHPDMS